MTPGFPKKSKAMLFFGLYLLLLLLVVVVVLRRASSLEIEDFGVCSGHPEPSNPQP